MGTLVKLYVYDLSNGLARQMSFQLTGKQIDGIWHTSVVVFGREVFYGQGISTTKPGMSHHGQPLQVVDMGETMIDEDTFDEYLQEISEVYTADKYHLLDFNCNSFTNDCMGFLVGRSIPDWIKNLPADFLSTPFGAALRPTIDNMFRRPGPGLSTPQAASSPASSLLQSVTAQAAGPSRTPSYLPTPAATPKPPTAASTVSAPLEICTNVQHFQSILNSNRAVSAFFTSRTCPPCRVVEPVFEDLAIARATSGVAFVKIDISSMMSGSIANAYGVRATPTFLFFLEGKQISEVKGANVPELRSQVDLLLFQAFPPHPHTTKMMPKLRAISMDPILFSQVPNDFVALQNKLLSFIDGSSASPSSLSKEKIKNDLNAAIIPFLRSRFDPKLKTGTPSDTATSNVCTKWRTVTEALLQILPIDQLFPLIDLWRLGLLDKPISLWCAASNLETSNNPVSQIMDHINASVSSLPKATALTTLRMLANAFANEAVARTLLETTAIQSPHPQRQIFTSILVATLLHSDVAVRTAASSLAFNVAAYYQRPRLEHVKSNKRGAEIIEEAEIDWNVELVSAVIEALKNETASEEVVHRLTATLAFLLHLSPIFADHIQPLLEVLQAKDVLLAKLSGGPEGCGEKGVTKKDIRELVEEVAGELCMTS